MADGPSDAQCDFWSFRSRLMWRTIAILAGLFFVGQGIYAIVVGNVDPTRKTFVIAVDTVFSIACLGLLMNSFFAGHLSLTRDRLTYRAFLRTRSYSRKDLLRAETQVRTRLPFPRRFNMPVLIEHSGRQYPLVELNTPLATDLYVLKSQVRVVSTEEDAQESLDGLTEWINSWIVSEDWISDRDRSNVTD